MVAVKDSLKEHSHRLSWLFLHIPDRERQEEILFVRVFNGALVRMRAGPLFGLAGSGS